MRRAAVSYSNPPPKLPLDVRLMNTTATLMFTLIGFALLALALSWGGHRSVFDIQTVHVEGKIIRSNLPSIRAQAVAQLSGNFFTLDLKSGQRAFENLPWVRRAVVRRAWPNALVVRLEEQRPVALWGTGDDSSKIVNHLGGVFVANLGEIEDDRLPALWGPDGSASRVLAVFSGLGPLSDALGARAQRLTLSERNSWRIGLDNGTEIELGRGDIREVLGRTERFASTVAPVLAHYQRPLEYADLRHNNGYALRLMDIATIVTPADVTRARKF